MPCTNGCLINDRVGGDHAYCTCHCHVGSLPAIPPSRDRRLIGFDVPGYSTLDKVVDERNALRDEVSELKRKLMETAFEREKMLNALILCSDALLVSTTALPEDREMVLQAQQAARKAIGNE